MLLTTLAILGGTVLALGLWFLWACVLPYSTFFRPVLIRGPRDGKRISLTFDDGPTAGWRRASAALRFENRSRQRGSK